MAVQTQKVVEKIVKPFDCLHYIDGKFVESVDKKTFNNVNPVTEEVYGTVAEGSAADIDLAVQAAKRALKEGPWGKMSTQERSNIIRKIGDILLERQEEIAQLESLDTGKHLKFSRHVDAPRAPKNFHFFADYMISVGTEAFQDETNKALNFGYRRPLGVVGLIQPWNLPLFLLTWKLAPALAAGNTVVIKPSELTPMTATLLMEILQEAGVPNGVVNLVHGFGPGAGSAINKHPDISGIGFIGQVSTGARIMAEAAPTLKKLSFELGGKNPNIIFADVDIDEVVDGTIRSSFTNQGEVCVSGSRIYVERPIFDEFVEKFAAKTRALKVGDPFDMDNDQGALVAKVHYDKVMSYLKIAEEEGGTFVTGGGRPQGLDKGYFIQPTIITGLDDNSRLVREEIFGPVVCVLPFDTEEEVIAKANDTRMGLSNTIWTNDIRRAHRVAQSIESGLSYINCWFLRDLRTPFGGTKDSGLGRVGGVHSWEFYTEITNICVKL
ncbi:aldehyde dehydrogenase [Schinkia azotoformans]|uniref:aldehyde dehydrogenase n=1 Tax=Schinkia azotoformans TaxID=1454 RepID=UPI002DBBE3C2|nr:aldehyde dehydrogenase [Schinkia azotoformans]MEC1715741.1 aldehyde dehydrogenase [Schinkia azotoformans]MEC1741380.1 aldehyde dehydrogenase [Schinkia azotoformans]MEC1744374.1 aldehyde dehydrogenase [Schinkia azotoformans]MEC1765437.1 aldehyde dehydrogenase [Schinkia azotoformans]MEC1787013.1 aldehyde dehydrogenase [Schinkia azotoformans]